MKKKLVQIAKIVTSFVISLTLAGCFAPYQTPRLMVRNLKEKGNCAYTTKSYWYVMEEKSIYTDPNTGQKYEVTLESQKNLNRKFVRGSDGTRHDYFHAKDMAFMAHLITQTWKEKYGVYRLNEIQRGLSKFHVIVAKNRKEFNRFWNHRFKDLAANAAMILSRDACFGTPMGANFVFVTMPYAFIESNPRTSIHEIVHMVSYEVQGHRDPKHRDHRFWTKMGDDALVPSVVQKYKKERPAKRH